MMEEPIDLSAAIAAAKGEAPGLSFFFDRISGSKCTDMDPKTGAAYIGIHLMISVDGVGFNVCMTQDQFENSDALQNSLRSMAWWMRDAVCKKFGLVGD